MDGMDWWDVFGNVSANEMMGFASEAGLSLEQFLVKTYAELAEQNPAGGWAEYQPTEADFHDWARQIARDASAETNCANAKVSA